MAYSRYRRKPRRSYRKSGPKRRSSARPSRYTGRTRRYTRKRPMSKKSVLNTTSRKKRNGMLTWSNTTNTGASTTVGQQNVFVNAAVGGLFLWCPTAMSLDAASVIPNRASRTASTCYMRGLSEHLRIQTSSGVPWFHRRICFTIRGSDPFDEYAPDDPAPTQRQFPYIDTSNGIERLFFNANINSMNNTVGRWVSILFKGVIQKDWNDYIVAPVDTTRVTLKFDKTWTLQSGNSNGVVRERKLWHPMNKNLIYDDDENGDVQTPFYHSTTAKGGMGDYYVMDFIQSGAGGTSSDIMQITANSSLYWHEK
uniref:Capsid protein n=1 Tax=Plant associated genomovirus 9 TaxID=2584403 RepID=A0A4Y5QD00_9VIRU|nr:capsid protein [Plant associated genomovirus 9]